ncbi:hypothetical protein I4U23_008704 [Adineta vaga]|nr:hypothetical protein I4U23_008704 [Adineta vaga]
MADSFAKKNSPCLVCSDKSIGYNFGVLTCMACKAFFRRNAVKLGTHEYVCARDGDCQIDHIYRRICNCCRLAKCFRVGMKRELILSEAGKQARKERLEQNRREREKVTKSNKLDMSIAIRDKQLVQQPDLYLSDFDRTLLRNIFNTYQSTCIAGKKSQYPDFPLHIHTNLSTFLNEYSTAHRYLIKYIQFIPEFNNLLLDDKVYVIRNQFGIVNNINEGIIHPGISNKLTVSFINIFGTHLADRMLQSIRRINQFTFDPLILKILLIVIAFSSGNLRNQCDINPNRIYDNRSSLLSAQNVYVEVLWKYILSHSSNEYDAVKYFIELTAFLMHLLDVHLAVDGYINSLSDEIEQMEPLMKSMWPAAVSSNVTIDTV